MEPLLAETHAHRHTRTHTHIHTHTRTDTAYEAIPASIGSQKAERKRAHQNRYDVKTSGAHSVRRYLRCVRDTVQNERQRNTYWQKKDDARTVTEFLIDSYAEDPCQDSAPWKGKGLPDAIWAAFKRNVWEDRKKFTWKILSFAARVTKAYACQSLDPTATFTRTLCRN